jgi:hypothetical protein
MELGPILGTATIRGKGIGRLMGAGRIVGKCPRRRRTITADCTAATGPAMSVGVRPSGWRRKATGK